jgi:predicted aminopeptidase
VVYVADDTTFNESFATAVERLGGAALAGRGPTSGAGRVRRARRRRRDFRAFTQRYAPPAPRCTPRRSLTTPSAPAKAA